MLIFTLALSPSLSMGRNTGVTEQPIDVIIPSVPGVEIDSIPTAADGDPLSLPVPLQQIVDSRVTAMSAAPAWVKELRSKTVAEYFPANLDDKSPEWSRGVENLLAEAQRLHQYFEQNDKSGLYNGFVEKKLSPFVKQIDAKKLVSAMRDRKLTRPLGEWTVETLVVTEQVAYLGRYPNFIKNTLGLVTGQHLRGASALAGVVALGAVGVYTAHHFEMSTGWFLAALLGSALGGAFQAGPLAAILNSATSWVIQPTTEFIRLISARYTGPWEQKINHVYDHFKPRSLGTVDAPRNEIPNIPTVAQDGMDFAGMTPEEQKINWGKNLRMWVAVAKTFGQLLRDTHHAGRVLMMVSWSDEQLTTTLVETMDTKLTNLTIKAETLLTPYKTAILANTSLDAEDRIKALASLEANFDLYARLNSRKWMDLDLDKNSLEDLNKQIDLIHNDLARAGMTGRDLAKLDSIQTQSAKATSTIVTALTLNEIRSFNIAEANRNLEGEARKAQRAIRNGFHLQDYVNKYRQHVQQLMEKMGYKNSRKPMLASPALQCGELLTRAG